MSGPKHSNFRLLEQERRRIEAERRRRLEEERRRQETLQHIAESWQQLRELETRVLELGETQIQEARRILAETSLVERIVADKQQVSKCIRSLPKQSEDEVEELIAFDQQLAAAVQKISVTVNVQLVEQLNRLTSEIHHQHVLRSENEFFSNLQNLAPVERQLFDLKYRQNEETNVNLQEALASFQELIRPYLDSRCLANKTELEAMAISIHKIAYNSQFTDEYKAILIEQRIRAFRATQSIYDRQIEQGEELFVAHEQLALTYRSLCAITGEPLRSELCTVPLTTLNNAMVELKVEIASLEKRWALQEDLDYIAETVHQVMNDLEYDIIATDFMQSPKRKVRHNMYELDAGSAVNVFSSDNGSVLFEVTGVSEGKREATALERLRVKETMEVFCDRYEEIKERLRERGVVLENEDLKPADERYVRMIDITAKTQLRQSDKTFEKRQQQRSQQRHEQSK